MFTKVLSSSADERVQLVLVISEPLAAFIKEDKWAIWLSLKLVARVALHIRIDEEILVRQAVCYGILKYCLKVI